MKHLAVVVDWYGPYTPEEARASSRIDYESGLYLGIGKRKHQKSSAVPQYVGLSKNLALRLATHNKLPDISRNARFWLGEVATAQPPVPMSPETTTSSELLKVASAHEQSDFNFFHV